MPFTAEMRRAVEQIRDYLYGGGYPDPVNNAEQLSFLFFFYLAEGLDAQRAARARVARKARASMFAGDWKLRNPLNAQSFGGKKAIPRESLRWSVWAKGLSGEPLVRFVRDEVFPFFNEVANGSAVNFMDGARLSIDEPTVLTQVINLVDGLRLDQADADSKGDLFEHVLKQIRQAGELGQFRTPRHIIRAIVEIVDPKIGESVYDPAAGTAGFLVGAYNHKDIKFLRKALRMNAKVLAESLGVTPETLSRWENDKDPIGPANEKLLRLIVGLTLSDKAPAIKFDQKEIASMRIQSVRPVGIRRVMCFKRVSVVNQEKDLEESWREEEKKAA